MCEQAFCMDVMYCYGQKGSRCRAVCAGTAASILAVYEHACLLFPGLRTVLLKNLWPGALWFVQGSV